MNNNAAIGIGLFGFGNIGAGVVRLLQNNAEVLRRNTGMDLELRRIVDIDTATDRGVTLPPDTLTDDKNTILGDPDISVAIELIGGAGIAKTIVEESLAAGKHVVSANKELFAKHGPELHALAAKNNVRLLYEASVGGGIPVLTPLLTCLRGNRINSILGIVNGTTNYMLTQMRDTGGGFNDILRDAQAKGYAEADPTSDIEGHDALYKTVILCAVGFGKRVDVKDLHCEGITNISTGDMENAAAMGYTIKLLSVCRERDGRIEARVHPALVPLAHPLAGIHGVLNAVYLEGDPIGPLMFVGQGAGPAATSSAVIGDVIALATDTISKTADNMFESADLAPMGECEFPFYIRMNVQDRAGVLAEVTQIMANRKISMRSVTQTADAEAGVAEIVWLTHPALEKNVQAALADIRALDCVSSVDTVIRVLPE